MITFLALLKVSHLLHKIKFHFGLTVFAILNSGLPKVTFWAVAEAIAEDGKTSAAVAEAVAEAEGLDFNRSLVGYQFA